MIHPTSKLVDDILHVDLDVGQCFRGHLQMTSAEGQISCKLKLTKTPKKRDSCHGENSTFIFIRAVLIPLFAGVRIGSGISLFWVGIGISGIRSTYRTRSTPRIGSTCGIGSRAGVSLINELHQNIHFSMVTSQYSSPYWNFDLQSTQYGRRLPPEMQASSGRKMMATYVWTEYYLLALMESIPSVELVLNVNQITHRIELELELMPKNHQNPSPDSDPALELIQP